MRCTFSVILQDKGMLLYPLLATIASILYIVTIFVPIEVLLVLVESDVGGERVAWGATGLLILLMTYFGLAFIFSFCKICVVYTTKTRFEESDASFIESILFGVNKIIIIFQ
jgi:hypothetical protein